MLLRLCYNCSGSGNKVQFSLSSSPNEALLGIPVLAEASHLQRGVDRYVDSRDA
jgi:hypothetical protein